MNKTRKVTTYIVILYVSISIANHVLTVLQKFPVNIWINRLVCIVIAGLLGGILGYCLIPKDADRKFNEV